MLYTSKAVGEWLGITDRQVRNLRDQGVLSEVRPGVFDMKVCVRQWRGYACRDQRSYLNPIHEEVSRPGVGRLIVFWKGNSNGQYREV